MKDVRKWTIWQYLGHVFKIFIFVDAGPVSNMNNLFLTIWNETANNVKNNWTRVEIFIQMDVPSNIA